MRATPYRIEYRGPEGWAVWADEDGVHLRAPRSGSLEAPDVRRLIALYQQVVALQEAGSHPAPKPPTREEIAGMRRSDEAEYLARRAAKAVSEAIDPTPDADAPF